MKYVYGVVSLVFLFLGAQVFAADVTPQDTAYYAGTVWTGSSERFRNVVLTMNHNGSFSYSYLACPSKEDLAGKDCESSGMSKKVSKSGIGWLVTNNKEGSTLMAQMDNSPVMQIVPKIDKATGVQSGVTLVHGKLVLKLSKELPQSN